MRRVHDEGVFEVRCPARSTDYRVEVDGRVADDPYRYLPTLGELDLQLIGEGRHERLWTVLGARALDGDGVAFAVWAPNAQGVRVVGDFTGWGPHDGWPMRSMGGTRRVGAARARTPRPGHRYKYRILGRDGVWREKADPLATLRRGARPHRLGGLPVVRTSGTTATGWPGARPASRTASR